jgi:hypothetical protein
VPSNTTGSEASPTGSGRLAFRHDEFVMKEFNAKLKSVMRVRTDMSIGAKQYPLDNCGSVKLSGEVLRTLPSLRRLELHGISSGVAAVALGAPHLLELYLAHIQKKVSFRSQILAECRQRAFEAGCEVAPAGAGRCVFFMCFLFHVFHLQKMRQTPIMCLHVPERPTPCPSPPDPPTPRHPSRPPSCPNRGHMISCMK